MSASPTRQRWMRDETNRAQRLHKVAQSILARDGDSAKYREILATATAIADAVNEKRREYNGR